MKALIGVQKILLVALIGLALPTYSLVAYGDTLKIPQTVAEHEALAKEYEGQATQSLKLAEEHKAMAEAYEQAHPDSKGSKNPWNEKMQKHCQALAAEARKLADDETKAAEYHRLRAQELKGK